MRIERTPTQWAAIYNAIDHQFKSAPTLLTCTMVNAIIWAADNSSVDIIVELGTTGKDLLDQFVAKASQPR